MAKKTNDPKALGKSANASLDNLEQKMDDIFRSTYNSRQDNRKMLTKISDDIYDTVNRISSGSEQVKNIPNITRLYGRLDDKNGLDHTTNDLTNSIQDILSNQNLVSSITAAPDINRYLKSMDSQYDLICKYMPKLEEALEIKKDNVLSADNFNKTFINFISDKISGEDKDVFDLRNTECRKKYKFDELAEEIYDDTAHYGEYFLWCVPYKKALERLLKEKGVSTIDAVRFESVSIMESGDYVGQFLESTDKTLDKNNKEVSCNINITFDKTFLLSESVLEYDKLQKIKAKINRKGSIRESFLNEASTDKLIPDTKILPDDLDYGKEFDNVANDGFITRKKKAKDAVAIHDIPGCILRKLDHYNVFPVYIEEVCVGYYYFEFSYSEDYDPARNNIINSATFPTHMTEVETRGNMYKDNPFLRELARKISDAVDAQFINANQDLKEEIFIMLTYNQKFNVNYDINNIRVTFLPAEDVFHFYFKLDKVTHHGISDLQKSLVPAMFWCLLDLSLTMGIVTRSTDKRIYYVKQNVDTNVAKTMMNVINQIKKGNMGIRQMESMHNILNIIGRYNDHVIPVGPNGDAPVQFEIMNGQNIEIPEQLLNKWEEQAINATDVPLEVVNSSIQMDFAIKYTMSNSKFLRKVFKRQAICETRYSELYTRIYNYEYNENETTIQVTLPAPSFLTMTNSTQLLQNTIDYINNIVAIEYPDGDENEKAEFVKLLYRHYLPTHINVSLIDRIKDQAVVNVAARTTGEEQ